MRTYQTNRTAFKLHSLSFLLTFFGFVRRTWSNLWQYWNAGCYA